LDVVTNEERRGVRRSTAMKRRALASKGRARTSEPPKPAKTAGANGYTEKVLSLIRAHPGIRPSELNRLLKVEQSDGWRNTLIKRGLIRKVKDGTAMRYYPV
jgi:hypothetical protein